MAKRNDTAATAPSRFRAVHYYCRMSPFKIRPVVDLIRGLDASEAREVLKFSKKRAALYVDRVLLSAMHNAQQAGVDVRDLTIAKAVADEGPTLKRWKAGPHGRVRPILRRRAHVEIELEAR
ncbi:MAG: 50S ribosomal protein L22 [Planctomycetota bacterium]|jgi:large subunit ribosomal protein L22